MARKDHAQEILNDDKSESGSLSTSNKRPFSIDTLMNRVDLDCTASANLTARSDETVIPDRADMMRVVTKPKTAADNIPLCIALHYVRPFFPSRRCCIYSVSSLQGLFNPFTPYIMLSQPLFTSVQTPFSQLNQHYLTFGPEPIASTGV